MVRFRGTYYADLAELRVHELKKQHGESFHFATIPRQREFLGEVHDCAYCRRSGASLGHQRAKT
jgi:hypothetical protein